MSEDNSGKPAEMGNIDHSNINGSNSKRLVQQAFDKDRLPQEVINQKLILPLETNLLIQKQRQQNLVLQLGRGCL
ncbi:unnamed protein product [Arctia plantaginis]|uniref:Uncharacterized protein n=1 Tax=Arctia plantaginis TaxID=874455 RepID=A0A8S1ANK0_ARCPL|nr:unnamed protein product [Arctia plantaginis]